MSKSEALIRVLILIALALFALMVVTGNIA